jgi:RecA-family ATPase
MSDKLTTYTIKDLEALPKPSWLVDDFVAEKSTTVIYGLWGAGKSYFVLDMCLTATTGADWFGGRGTLRPLKTLYVVAEGIHHWLPRVKAYKHGRGPVDPANILFIGEPVQLFDRSKHDTTPNGVVLLENEIRDFEPDILVIDTWVRCTSAYGMNENDAGDTATVIRELDRLRDEYNVSPVIVHHTTKAGDDSRGSGNLSASVERVVQITVDGKSVRKYFKVEDKKGNHTAPFDDFELRFEDQAWENPDGSIESAAILTEGNFSGEDAGPTPGTQADIIYTWLQNNPGMHKGVDVARATGIKSSSVWAGLNKLKESGLIDQNGGVWGIN